MTMTEKFKILSRYIKDLSSETPNLQTYLFVKDRISKYQLSIDINSIPLKNKLIEVASRCPVAMSLDKDLIQKVKFNF